MPHYEWQRGEPFRDHANDRIVTEGEVVVVSEELASGHAAFVRVEEPDDSDANPGDSGGEASESNANSGETSEADGAEDTPLAEKHWRTAVSEVEAGEYDDRLSELAARDDLTDSVADAVASRLEDVGE